MEINNEYWTIPMEISEAIVESFSGKRNTYLDQLLEFLNGYVKKNYEQHWKNIHGKEFNDNTQLLRALNLNKEYGIYIRNGKTHQLDLLCLFAFRLNWLETLKKFHLDNEKIPKRRYYKINGVEIAVEDNTQAEILETVKNIEKEIQALRFVQERNLDSDIQHQIELLIEEKEQLKVKLEDAENTIKNYEDEKRSKPDITASESENILLSARDAALICISKNIMGEILSISQQGTVQQYIRDLRTQWSLADARSGKSAIWVIEYIDLSRRLLLPFMVTNGNIIEYPQLNINSENLQKIPRINFLYIDSEIAVRNALPYAKRLRIINDVTSKDYFILTKLAFFSYPLNNFAWRITFLDKTQCNPILVIYINPKNGKITIPYPSIVSLDPFENFLYFFMHELDLEEDSPAVIRQMESDFRDRIENRINRMILDNLPESALDDFDQLLDKESESIARFVKSYILDFDEKINKILMDFRREYIAY